MTTSILSLISGEKQFPQEREGSQQATAILDKSLMRIIDYVTREILEEKINSQATNYIDYNWW